MPEAYSKPYQISKMMRHIENSGIVKTVYSDIFRDSQEHSAIFLFRNIQEHSAMFRHIEGH